MTATHETTLILPHGAWPSPVSTTLLTARSTAIREPASNGRDLLWIESRPQERGRYVLVQAGPDGTRDVTPPPWNVRNRVHEYGGGAWVADGDVVVFSDFASNRLHRIDGPGCEPVPITPEGDFRYADLQLDRGRGHLYAVREDHHPEHEPINTLVRLDLAGPNPDGGDVLFSGTDFVHSPRLNRDGTRLAWIGWNHPHMPWDETVLSYATLTPEGRFADESVVVRSRGESVILPGWDHADRLLFVSDRTGWWHLYRHDDGQDTQLTDGEREFGIPLWVFGESTWALLDDGTIATAWTRDGLWSLSILDPETQTLTDLDLPFVAISSVRAHPDGRRVTFKGGTAHQESTLVILDPATGTWESVGGDTEPVVDPAFIAVAEPVSWPTPDGSTAHGFFYPPVNPQARAPEGTRPPLIVESHGGPTGSASATLDLGIQFWTSRGFAVLDVNYGGSTGFGRSYRERLDGQWGEVDVDDCVSGAHFLAEAGRVDGDRMAIRGGSAGGFTTLAALTFRDAFRAGVSYYGIGDLEAMALDTHKFESRYLDGLVGPYPEARDTYIARSPVHHVDRLNSAMLLFQGMDDKVVPPNQCFMMAAAVRRKGLPVAVLAFDGEGHGFRMAETIARTLQAELSFFAQVFGFTPADDVPALDIDNLPADPSAPRA